MEGLGATLAEDSNDMVRALRNGEPRYFVKDVATGTVPADELFVNSACVSKRVIPLRIGCVDRLPRWQDEHPTVKAICIEQALKLRAWYGGRFVHHCDGLDCASIEEDPLAAMLLLHVLLGIATQDLLSKGERLRPR